MKETRGNATEKVQHLPADRPRAPRARRSIPAKLPKARTTPRGSTARAVRTFAGRATCSSRGRNDLRRTYRSTRRRSFPSTEKKKKKKNVRACVRAYLRSLLNQRQMRDVGDVITTRTTTVQYVFVFCFRLQTRFWRAVRCPRLSVATECSEHPSATRLHEQGCTQCTRHLLLYNRRRCSRV